MIASPFPIVIVIFIASRLSSPVSRLPSLVSRLELVLGPSPAWCSSHDVVLARQRA